MFVAKNYDCHFHKRQKINDSLGGEEEESRKQRVRTAKEEKICK